MRKRMSVPFIIRPGHIITIVECSRSTANRKLCEIKDALGKPKNGLVTLKQYCDYEGFDINDVIEILL